MKQRKYEYEIKQESKYNINTTIKVQKFEEFDYYSFLFQFGYNKSTKYIRLDKEGMANLHYILGNILKNEK